MKKVVAYIRVSTKGQEELSPETQRQVLADYAHGHDLQIVQAFDETHSAYRPGRPEYEAMLAFLRKRKDVVGVLVYKLDRLWRNEVDYAALAAMDDISLFSATEDIPDGATGRFLTTVYAAIARLSSDQTSERVKDAARMKARKGGWPGPAPTGYINDREAKVLRPDPIMASIVKLVFETYVREDISLSRLVHRARDLGLRTRKGGVLSKGPLHKLLTNPVYYGMTKYEGVLFPGNHEPLISKALFDAVQDRLHGKSSPLTKRSFPYRGFMTCGYCGCKITASLAKGRYTYYHCTRGKGTCEQDFVPEDRIGDMFLPLVENVRLTRQQVRALLEGIRSEGERRRKEAKRHMRAIRLQERELGEMRGRAYEDKLTGAISEDWWIGMERRWSERENQLRNQMELLELGTGPAEDEAEATFKLLQRAPALYQRQSHDQRARLLKVLLSNSVLVDRKLDPIYKKPFDLVAEGVHSGSLLLGEDSNLQPFG